MLQPIHLLAAAVAAGVLTIGRSLAGTFQASTFVSGQTEGFGFIGNFPLPKYPGTATITGVNVSFSGYASGDTFFNYFEDDGITIAPFSEQWDIGLAVPGAGAPLVAPVTVEFPGVSIPPGPYDNASEVDIKTGGAAFSGSVSLTDFSDYAGIGSNDSLCFSRPRTSLPLATLKAP
jgi:hypothetical protein